MYSISQEEKDAYKSSASVKRAYISIVPLSDDEEEIILDDDEHIKDFTILDDIYTPEQGIIGSVISKQLTLNLFKPIDLDLTNREVDVFIGIEMGEEVKYIPYGRYIIQKPENETLTDRTSFEAFDYMIKFNLPYKDILTYPCTIKDVLNAICELCEVECVTDTFANSDFVVENNQFVGGESCRDILMGIAQISGTYAKIDRENKLHLELLNQDQENINDDVYNNDVKINNTFGPVNRLILRMSQVEGENVVVQDDESIEQIGVKELTISDNPFTYTQEKREQAINNIWDIVKGLTYTDYEARCSGMPYLDTGDVINIMDKEQHSLCNSYIFSHEIIFSGALSSNISATADTETETKYLFIPELSNRLKHTEIVVDKANQQITSLVEETGVLDARYSQMQQNIDSIRTSVGLLGGNNLQHNSIGAYGTEDYEQNETGTIIATEEELLKSETDNGFGRIIYLSNNKWFKFRSEQLKIGDTYTLSFKYSNTENNHCVIKLNNNTETVLVDTLEEEYLDKVVYTFEANTEYVELEVITGDLTMGITDYYLQVGTEATRWQPASGEALSTSLEIYYNGIKVKSATSEIITDISNQGFTVENINGKILITFNKDKCILSDTEVNGILEQNGWRRYNQRIDSDDILLEVKV